MSNIDNDAKYNKRTTINALDPSQKYILDKITSEGRIDDLSLIYGPPGTGKSHLIVSLLFELAYANKKVLFVSQNREALDVVIRKFKDIDKKMGVGETDLSFLDLCLNLSDPSERTLKYIRGLKERLYKSTSQSPSTPGVDSGLPYALSYRNLDKEANSDFSLKDEEIGIDELLSYGLEFINSGKKLIKVPIRRIDDVDVRGAFAALRDYREKSDKFTDYCSPSDALRYIAPVNSAVVTIGKIQDPVQDIEEALNSLGDIKNVKCKSDNEIGSIIKYLSTISVVAKDIDVVALKKDSIAFSACCSAINEAKILQSRLIDTEKLDNDTLPSELMLTDKEDKIVYNSLSIDELIERSKALSEIEQILNANTSDSCYFTDVVTALVQDCDLRLKLILGSYGIEKFHAKDIGALLQETREWLSNGLLYRKALRLTSGVPDMLKWLNDSQIEVLWNDYSKNLQTTASVLNNTDNTVGLLNIIASRDRKTQIKDSVSKAKKIELANKALMLLSGDMKSLLTDNNSVGFLKEKIKQWKKDIAIIEKIISDNKISRRKSAGEVLGTINDNVRNRNTIKSIESQCSRYQKYFKYNDKEELLRFLERIEGLTSKQIGSYELALACYDFSEVGGFDDGEQDKLSSLQKAIDNAREEEVYSEEFFTVAKGEKLSQWGARICALLDYENRNELQYYSDYNDFVRRLSKALGPSNSTYLQNYINDKLDYVDFAENIAYDLIRCTYDNIPISKMKSFNTKSYFSSFRTNLDKTRDRFYKMALNLMSGDPKRIDAARRLATPRLFKDPGGGVMKKICANTDMIVDAYPVILATPAEVAKYIAPNKEIFDFVIFDEASQLLPGQAIPSIYRAKKAVIVGDPHQMPPTKTVAIGGALPAIGLDGDSLSDERSILDLVKSMQIDSTYHLKVHYRSKYNILFEPSRRAIYAQDDIRPIFEAKTTKMPLFIRDDLGENEEDIYRAIIDRVNYYIDKNPKATFCILFTQKINKNMATEVGFMRYLENAGDSVKSIVNKCTNEDILISTITNCQGISGDHTILCIPYYTSPRSMFFFRAGAGAYKRLNVSITRQIESLDIIMGDPRAKWINVCRTLIDNPSTEADVILSAELMEGLLENAGRQIDEEWLESELGRNVDYIDSPLAAELYEKLSEYLRQKYDGGVRVWCEVGYKIRTPDYESKKANDYNVGYRIDLGVYSRKHKRFILGIEMDGAAYHTGFSKEFSDAQRQIILESKGWTVYRIWSKDWIDNREAEFNKLIQTIDEIESEEPEPEEQVSVVIPETTPRLEEIEEVGESEKRTGDDEGPEPAGETREIEHIMPEGGYMRARYWVELTRYCTERKRLGKPIEIKCVPNGDITKENIDRILMFPYQRMIVVEVGEGYIMARPEGLPSHLKIDKTAIVAYKE